MGRGFLKGVVLGAIVSTIVLTAASALAGTGVGAVFNLGKTNSVNKPSTLTGMTSNKMLQVTNKGSGPALGLTVGSGVAPFKVNSTKRVAKLNADLLDGVDSTGFMTGTGRGFLKGGSVDVSGVFDPDKVTASLGSIAGLGSFTLVGSFASAGNDCRIEFTNSSGGSLAVNGNANPGLANGATIELTGADARPQGANATFTIMAPGATTVASGQVTLAFGFPSANTTCAGSIQGLVSG